MAKNGLNDFVKGNDIPREQFLVMPGGPSMTRQEFAAECDINTIMAQYEKHLADPMMSLRAAEARYVDFTEMPHDLMGAMDVLNKGTEAFMSLPASVRREFDNDPVQFVDFASNPANLDVMREWGLAPAAPKAPEPPAAPASPPAAQPPAQLVP